MMKVFNCVMPKVLALFVFVFILTRCNISNNTILLFIKALARDGVISFILALISSLSKAMVRIAFAFDV